MTVEKMVWSDVKTAKSAAIKMQQLLDICVEYQNKANSCFDKASTPNLSAGSADFMYKRGQAHQKYVTLQYSHIVELSKKFNLPIPVVKE